MRMISLQSSQLASIGYDPAEETLVAQFQNGDLYTYSGVPEGTFTAIVTDPDSHGRAFNELVKAKSFPFAKVEPEDVQGLGQ